MYRFAALAATGGVTAAAIVAVHYRFTWQLASSGAHFSSLEAGLTLLLTLGGVVSSLPSFHGFSVSTVLLDHCCCVMLTILPCCSGWCWPTVSSESTSCLHQQSGTCSSPQCFMLTAQACRLAWRCGLVGLTKLSGTTSSQAGSCTSPIMCLELGLSSQTTSLPSSTQALPSASACTAS